MAFMLQRAQAIAHHGHELAAAGSVILAQTGVEPWLPLIVTVVNLVVLLLKRKSQEPAKRSKGNSSSKPRRSPSTPATQPAGTN